MSCYTQIIALSDLKCKGYNCANSGADKEKINEYLCKVYNA